MKLSHIALALAATLSFSAAAQARDISASTTAPDGGTLEYTIHTATLHITKNPDGKQANTYVTFIKNGEVTRTRYGVAGCVDGAGKSGWLNEDGSVRHDKVGQWFYDGPTVRDDIASSICVLSGLLKPPADSTQSGYTPGSKPGKFAL